MALDAPHREYSGVQQNSQVHKEAAILEVVKVVLNVFMDQVSAVSAKLPQPGDARVDLKALALALSITAHDEWHFRSRPDQAHIAFQHIEQLRQLIKTGAPQVSAYGRDSRIPGIGRRALVRRRADVHRAKLV